MTNKKIAKLLRNVAAALTVLDEKNNRFRIIAYNRAADEIENLTSEAIDLWKEGKLASIPGIGSGLKDYLEELFKKGRVKHFESILNKIPKGFFFLLDVPGMGPKRAFKLIKSLKLKTPHSTSSGQESEKIINELEKAGKGGKIAKIAGFGEKSEAEIVKNIESFKKGQQKKARMILSTANQIATEVINYLKKNKVFKRVDTLGSLRRMMSTVGDIDISAVTENSQEALNWFIKYPKVQRVIEKGDVSASISLNNNVHVDLMVMPEDRYGSLLQHFTGSKQHNIHLRELALKKKLSLSEYGIKPISRTNKKILKFNNEKSFYNFLALDWIPPELREDTGEIEASINHRLPSLVKLADIRGDLHIHSNYNLEPSHDLGQSSIEELLNQAKKLNYEYVGITDHSPSVNNHTKEQIYDILKRRNEYFEQKRSSNKNVRVFIMLEVDISANGNLSIENKSLALLDGAIASIHSGFNQDKKTITKRILTALSNPYIKILGHPTGRLLSSREAYEIDWELVFEACLKYDKVLEINSWPERLDLPDVSVREAIKRGIKLVINSDSHQVSEMLQIKYGVSVARRGWAEKPDILNCLSYNEISKWLKSSA